MNSKIILAAITVGLAAIIGFIAFSGSQIINDVTEDGFGRISSPIKVIPIEVELTNLSVLSITEEDAQMQIDFKITNPNYKSVILQMIKYELYNDGKRVFVGQIGERVEGAIDSSNYFTILRDNPQILGDKFTIKNTGTDPKFWSSLTNNDITWTVKGEVYFNLSSMTSGHENVIPFEFTQ